MYNLCDLFYKYWREKMNVGHLLLPLPERSESMGTPLTPPAETGFPACSSFINLKG